MSKRPLVSVIIPAYNEERAVSDCLDSLAKQSYRPLEVIVVDDGSSDKTKDQIKKFKVKLLKQNHKGPGSARNLGAAKAKGEILVFVDADMTFDKNFIIDLVKPILKGQTIGTFSKNEMNANKNNLWSVCWNINRGWPVDRLIPRNYPDFAPVYRAILKKEFEKVSGFDESGDYTDDWSLSRKLGKYSTLAKGAIYYHTNPETLKEVWKQASWIGKNEFISGTLIRKIKSILTYNPIASAIIGTYKSILKIKPIFFVFKVIYDLAVFKSVILSFAKQSKAK